MLNWLKRLFGKNSEDEESDASEVPEAKEDGAGGEEAVDPSILRGEARLVYLEGELLKPLSEEGADLAALFPHKAPGRPSVFQHIFSELSQEDPGRAVQVLRRFERRLGDHVPLLQQMARLYEHRNERDSARTLWERLLTLTDDADVLVEANHRIAQMLENKGDAGLAFVYYQRALSMDWERPGVLEACQRLVSLVSAQRPAPIAIVAHEPPEGFCLEHPLGRGGYGTVYLGRDETLGREVAMKFLHPHLKRRPDRVQALFEEARLVASLGHPGIVQLYELDTERCMIVMEYMTHGTLSDRLTSGRALHPVAALDCARDVCRTLDYVHDKGVLHRDIKPGNILFREASEAVLGDFGIAGLEEGASGGAATQLYAAPEALGGGLVDRRADLFGVGLVLAEMLTAEPPPAPGAARDAWLRHASEAFPQEMQGAVLSFLSSVCAEQPSARPATAAAMDDALVGLTDGLQRAQDHVLARRVAAEASEGGASLELLAVIEDGLRQ